MRIVDCLADAPTIGSSSELIYLDSKYLRGIDEEFGLNSFDELKGKEIEVIDIIQVGESKIEITENGASISSQQEPHTVEVRGFDNLGNKIKLAAIHRINGNVYVRCTEDSIKK
jgi:hypothetical protein